jgi:hypothetical protein
VSPDQVTSLFMAAAMVGGWLAEHAAQIAIIAAVGGFAWWNIRRLLRGDDYRSGEDPGQDAWLAVCNDQRPEPAQPGTDQQLLDACRTICPDLARKEKP